MFPDVEPACGKEADVVSRRALTEEQIAGFEIERDQSLSDGFEVGVGECLEHRRFAQ